MYLPTPLHEQDVTQFEIKIPVGILWLKSQVCPTVKPEQEGGFIPFSRVLRYTPSGRPPTYQLL